MNDRRKMIIAVVIAAIGGLLMGLLVSGGGSEKTGAEPQEQAQEDVTYTCSMHPSVQSKEPGQCPICGMDLVPVSSDGGDETSPVRVQLSKRAQELARVRTVPVKKLGDGGGELRLLGRIEQDETGVRTVTSWTAGRIDRLHVATTGEKVRAGQTIATLYSPEVYTAHRDLLQSLRQLKTLSSGMAFARSSAEATVESSRQKLRLLGVSNQQITSMEKAEEPWTQINIRTRFGGTVVERLVNEGAYVQAGSGLYRVADLSRLWVQLDAYETDLPRLRLGQHVSLVVEAMPGEVFDGTIAFIDPVVDPAKRTARVRVEVPTEGVLRPGMFVEAKVTGGRAVGEDAPLVVPATAPLFLGRRSVVYVEVPDTERPTYEAREISLGTRAGDVYPIVDGLVEGERVVVHGAFAIDADLQIRGGDSLMTRDDDANRVEPIEVSSDFRDGLAPIVRHYLDLQSALADDDLDTARVANTALSRAADEFAPDGPFDAAEVWLGLRAEIKSHAKHLDQAKDLETAREAFLGFSRIISKLLNRFGNPTDTELRIAYCPMAFENEGAEWIQAAETIDNSYFGASMLTCGEIRETIPPALDAAKSDGGTRE